MGTGKKEATRKERQGKNDGMGNVRVKGENFYRDAKKVKTLNRLTKGTAQRNAKGDITKAAVFQSREKPVARVEPNRKWFNATRVISQDALEAFRGAVAQTTADPYSFLLKSNKLPMSLIRDAPQVNGLKEHRAKMAVETQPFSDTFGPKAQRKRVKLETSTFEDLAGETVKMHDTYLDRLEQQKLLSGELGQSVAGEAAAESEGTLTTAREAIFSKGQSKRIWNELYKTVDSSDVLLMVLDARDPEGTRCRSVEKYLREEAPHKHLVFVLNKVDLVPSKIAAAWVRILSKEHPCLAFHASVSNSFGKGSLIGLLRQFSALHKDRKQISVGLIGYPNTGKSSIINTLRKKKVCTVAPIAGETKVWQYVTLMKRIYLIDSPGIVPPNKDDTDEQLLLRGVVRVENTENPHQYVEAVLRRCQPKHVNRTYEINGYADATEFCELIARKAGRLLKGGEPDLDGVAKMVINDFLRGKLPWFVPPPTTALAGESEADGVAGRDGRMGEMTRKRKRTEGESEPNGNEAQSSPEESDDQTGEDEDDAFEGFDEEDDIEISDDEESGEEDAGDEPADEDADAKTLVDDEESTDDAVQAVSNVKASPKASPKATSAARKRRRKG